MPDLIFPRSRPLVTSVHTRLGAVVGEAGDYDADEITFTPAGTIAATDVQAAIEELDDDIQALTDSDDQTAAEVPFTPAGTIAATDVQAAIEELDDDIQGLGPGYSDDDVIDVLIDVIEDGYGINWVVTTDSLGTHFAPDRIVTRSADAYASEIEIDLLASVGEWHDITLTGNPTLLVTNFEHNDPGEPGKKFVLRVVQDGTGGRTIDFAGSSQTWTFADGEPALTTVPGGLDLLEFLVVDVADPEFLFIRSIHRPRRRDASATPIVVGFTEPIAVWHFEESSNSNRVDEINSIVLEDMGPSVATVAGVNGNAATFDDLADELRTDFIPQLHVDPALPYTMAYWIKARASGGVIYLMATGGVNSNILALVIQGGSDWKAEVRVTAGGDSTTLQSGNLSFSAWHLVLLRFDPAADTLAVSVDGGVFATTACTRTFEDLADWRVIIGSVNDADLDELAIFQELFTDDQAADMWNAGTGQFFPFTPSSGDAATLDWLRELNYVLLESGTGSYTITLGDVLPSQVLRVAVENDGATGTVDWGTVDWGSEGTPSLPGDGAFDLFELTAVDATHIVGRTLQTGCTP